MNIKEVIYMGAWGFKTFENDYALDWVDSLICQNKKDMVIRALKEIELNNEYIEGPECSEALCAIELISSIKSEDSSNLTEELLEWINEKRGLLMKSITFSQSEIDLAISTLQKIINDSELKELWQESDNYQEWISYQLNLERKLKM